MNRALLVAILVTPALAALAAADAPDPRACATSGAACLDIARKYFTGDGVEKNDAKARTFFLKGCDKKVGEACGYAASLMIDGVGGARHLAAGHALREKACTLGFNHACNDLGSNWAEATGGVAAKNFAKAKRYYDKACTLRDGLGCFNLGNVFRLGEGVAVDMPKAIALFQQACDLDAAGGCTELAIIYYEGKATPRDTPKALALLEKGCTLGSEVACKNAELLAKQP